MTPLLLHFYRLLDLLLVSSPRSKKPLLVTMPLFMCSKTLRTFSGQYPILMIRKFPSNQKCYVSFIFSYLTSFPWHSFHVCREAAIPSVTLIMGANLLEGKRDRFDFCQDPSFFHKLNCWEMETMITIDVLRFERVKGAAHGDYRYSSSPVYYLADFGSSYH